MAIPTVKLSDGSEIPQIGLGLWKVKDQAEFNTAFESAVAAGYRHFDTAQAYGNERFLGEALKNSGLKREDVWITTKIRVETIAIGRAAESIPKSLEHLETEYVDLLLIHFPISLFRKGVWKLLEETRA